MGLFSKIAASGAVKVVKKGVDTVKKFNDNKTKITLQKDQLKHDAYMAGLDYRGKVGSKAMYIWACSLFLGLLTIYFLTPFLKHIPGSESLLEDYGMIIKSIGTAFLMMVVSAIIGVDKAGETIKNNSISKVQQKIIDRAKEQDKHKAVIEKEKIKAGVVGDDYVKLEATEKAITKVKKYVKEFAPYAIEVEKKYGLPASAVLAHSATETWWNEKVLEGQTDTGQTIKSNSYFNIKVSDDWNGLKVKKRVHEYDKDGKKYWTDSWFRAYATPRESFLDYGKFLHSRDRYKPLLLADDPEEFADKLYETGYFTAKYAPETIKKIMRKNFKYET